MEVFCFLETRMFARSNGATFSNTLTSSVLSLVATWVWRDESKHGGGVRDVRNFDGRMAGKNTSAGAGFAHSDRRDAG